MEIQQTTVLRMRKLLSIATGAEPAPSHLPAKKQKTASKCPNRPKKWRNGSSGTTRHSRKSPSYGGWCHERHRRHNIGEQSLDAIIERWEGKGMQLLSFLYQQLMSTKIEEEEDLTTGFNSIKSTVSKIKTLGESISDFLLAQIIMNALPPSYAIVSTSSRLYAAGTITSNAVCEAALQEEERQIYDKKISKEQPKREEEGLRSPLRQLLKAWSHQAGMLGKRQWSQRHWSPAETAELKAVKGQVHKSQANTSKGDSAKVAVTDKSGNSSVGPKIYALTVSDKSSHNKNLAT
ncbi:Retrovirus-related Pol polyprotein from transposon TNT 1-94 [Rhizoctonia solani]|uniref:Retrovirus-related Pol polyprotein from transposon TNT 1-94 n=1 Tax=Rhizoctonia solani TaxID=456999 RepID=A0A8H8NZM6_9AGAM|nr:Retrovirus-related Pol polyprotein from transposon TNT 1-94 [Rhizoctonia solani]QRW23011.1 Retrovirus-related Pol polyprotein from transposon TNT 1-94 [Rhizoctonia solani]